MAIAMTQSLKSVGASITFFIENIYDIRNVFIIGNKQYVKINTHYDGYKDWVV